MNRRLDPTVRMEAEDMTRQNAALDLGCETSKDSVTTNPNRSAERAGSEDAVPRGPEADEELRKMVLAKAESIYGSPLPEIVRTRVDKELGAIVGHGFSTLYLIDAKLVSKLQADGHVAGYRTLAGSSLAAYLSGITEVNPLPPHYICPKCGWTEFKVSKTCFTGLDLPRKQCPKCAAQMTGNGFDLPFEILAGIDGDRLQDTYLSLTFSGSYQLTAPEYLPDRFRDIDRFRDTIDLNLIFSGPYQLTAQEYLRERAAYWAAYQDADLTMLEELGRLTGVNPRTIPLDDPEVFRRILSLFSGTEALGITSSDLETEGSGVLGISKFGTKLGRDILKETSPNSIDEIIRVFALSCGTGAWVDNAQKLIRRAVPLHECICTRDDVMTQMVSYGVDPKSAFNAMERVRKGKGLRAFMQEDPQALSAIPPHFLDRCEMIRYLCSRAYAVVRVLAALRIAYFKLYFPAEFYRCYLARNARRFDVTHLAVQSLDELRAALAAIRKRDCNEPADNESALLEVLIEMNLRGIHVSPADISSLD